MAKVHTTIIIILTTWQEGETGETTSTSSLSHVIFSLILPPDCAQCDMECKVIIITPFKVEEVPFIYGTKGLCLCQ